MLCPNCTRYTWHSVAGSCKNCSAATPNHYQQLCAQCSTTLDECEICRTHMGTKSGGSSSGSASGWTIKKSTKDSGGAVTLKVGDELEVTLDETRSKEWFTGYAHSSSIISESKRCDFIQSQSNYNQGTRTIKLKANAAGTTTLELDEWQMKYDWNSWSGSSWVKDKKTGNTWKLKITVK